MKASRTEAAARCVGVGGVIMHPGPSKTWTHAKGYLPGGKVQNRNCRKQPTNHFFVGHFSNSLADFFKSSFDHVFGLARPMSKPEAV
jgi:hypothetical protein